MKIKALKTSKNGLHIFFYIVFYNGEECVTDFKTFTNLKEIALKTKTLSVVTNGETVTHYLTKK